MSMWNGDIILLCSLGLVTPQVSGPCTELCLQLPSHSLGVPAQAWCHACVPNIQGTFWPAALKISQST